MTRTIHLPLTTLCLRALSVPQQTTPRTVAVSRSDVPLSLRERASVLEIDVTRALARGAQLESHTATVAVVAYHDGHRNHLTHLLMAFLKTRLGLFIRVAAGNEKWSRVMLAVDECGNITRRVLPS
jgi:hypothetical protein